MSNAVSIARYLLDEASSGQIPSIVVDDTGNGNDLSINYNGAFFAYTNVASGNGLDASETVATAGTGVADLSDIANNGNIGASLNGATELSLLLHADCIEGHVYGMRVFHLGTSSGNGDFAVVLDVARLVVRWDDEAGGDGAYVYYFIPSGITTIAVVIDTTAVIAVDRCRVYFDASLQTANSGSLPQNSALGGINASDRYISLLNRPSLNRNPIAKLFYAELFTGQLTELQISAAHTALSLNNDANWDSTSGTTPVSSDLYLQWNAHEKVTNDLTLQSQIVNAVTSDINLAWELLNSITADRTLTWRTLNAIAADLQTQFDMHGNVNANLSLLWDINAALQAVTADLTLQANIYNAAQSDLQLTWDLLNTATNDINLAWRTLNVVTRDLDTRWSIREVVNADVEFKWSLNSSLTSVITDLDLRYEIYQPILATLDTGWNMLQSVISDLTSQYDIANMVIAELTTQHQIRNTVLKDISLRWDSLEIARADITFHWSLNGLAMTPINIMRINPEHRRYAIKPEMRTYQIRR